MSDVILVPYNYTVLEKEKIKNNFKNHSDWSKVIFANIKENIINHLRIEQENTCCYCKFPLGFDIKQVDIEHIVPKSEYEQFTFEPKNLALSCPACNTKKSIKPVLKKSIVKYPTNGLNFIIVHAHFDNYSDHIEIIDNCVFVAKTSKGSETITYCELFRLSAVEERTKISKNLNPSLMSQLIEELQFGNQEDKDKIIAIIKDSIR